MSADDEDGDVLPPPLPRVFISRVDTYFGKILAQHLGRSLPGASGAVDSESSDKENYADLGFLQEKPKEGAFHVSASWNAPTKMANSEMVLSEPIRPPLVPAVQNLVLSDNDKHLNNSIHEADIVILHINDDDGKNSVLKDAARELDIARNSVAKLKKPKTLILISTTMTWAKTRRSGQEDTIEGQEKSPSPLPDDEEEEIHAFNEEDYRKRRPHPAYRKHLELEKDFLKFGRDSKGLLITTVVAAGLVYGCGDSILHWMLKDAWQGKKVPVIVPGDGKTHIPMIHVRDLCQVVHNICDAKPKSRYVIAVDDGKEPLSKVCEAISKVLSTGQTLLVPANDLLYIGKISQSEFDILTCDLRMGQSSVKDPMKVQWVAGKGFVESAVATIQEYRTVCHLTPIKLLIIGLPFTGKTTMAKRLSEFYAIDYLKVEDVVKEALKALHDTIEVGKVELLRKAALAEEDAEEEEEEGPTTAELAQELLTKIDEGRANNNDKLEEIYVLQFVRERLLSSTCQNQGFILDNYPDTHERARELFRKSGEDLEGLEGAADETNEEEAAVGEFDSKIIPDYVIFLEADDNFLRERMMSQTDPGVFSNPSIISIEQTFKDRMAEYKATHENETTTALAYFDEVEIPTINLPIAKDATNDAEICLKTVITKIGPPHNYGLTMEQKITNFKKEETVKLTKEKEKNELTAVKEEQELAGRRRHCSEWASQMDEIHREKYQTILNGTPPIHNYLTKNLLPAVQRGLVAITKCRPADPVDFLGEFLIQLTNPLTQGPVLPVDKQLIKVARHDKI